MWLEAADIFSRINIECSQSLESEEISKQRYELVLEKLWKSVCVRLISETLNKLSKGEKLSFDEITVDKDGILLKKKKLFTSEDYYAKWDELRIGTGPGYFIIGSSKDEKAQAKLSYRDVNNVHILESVMRFLWKDGNCLKLRQGMFS